MPGEHAAGTTALPHRCVHCLHSNALQDSPQNIYLARVGQYPLVARSSVHILCITLPSASSTACDVKFSEGMRLMKCFCRLFSYNTDVDVRDRSSGNTIIRHTFCMISYTVGSASSRSADSNCKGSQLAFLQEQLVHHDNAPCAGLPGTLPCPATAAAAG